MLKKYMAKKREEREEISSVSSAAAEAAASNDMLLRKRARRKNLVSKYVFILAITIVPIVQFCIFYLGVNINSILLAFQEYNDGLFTFTAGFSNFGEVFTRFSAEPRLLNALSNSAIMFLLDLCISIPFCLVSAYFIWKKTPFSGFFKVVLMLPSMISATVFCVIARFFLEVGVPRILGPSWEGLITTAGKDFWTTTIYDIWLTFASNLILYLGAMSAVSVDVAEYGKIDGMNAFQEFIHVIMPAIFPTLIVFLMTSVARFFTNYGSRYTFYEDKATEGNYTLGYYFFVIVVKSSTRESYPFAAAAGIVFTCVAVPLTLLTKYLLEKFGPKED